MSLCFPDAVVRRAQGWLPSAGGAQEPVGPHCWDICLCPAFVVSGPRRGGEAGRSPCFCFLLRSICYSSLVLCHKRFWQPSLLIIVNKSPVLLCTLGADHLGVPPPFQLFPLFCSSLSRWIFMELPVFHVCYVTKSFPLIELFFFFLIFVYFLSAVLSIHCWAGFSLVAVNEGSSLVVACRLLLAVASPAAEHRLRVHGLPELQPMDSAIVAPSLSNCGSRASLLHGMWGPLRLGMEPCLLHWPVDSPPLSYQGSPFIDSCIYFSRASSSLLPVCSCQHFKSPPKCSGHPLVL